MNLTVGAYLGGVEGERASRLEAGVERVAGVFAD
jgi:hypothetical protein